MTYEETLRHMLEIYPILFVNEADALSHLFLTNGNGYEWVKGELVSLETPEWEREYSQKQNEYWRSRGIDVSEDPEIERAKEVEARKKRAVPLVELLEMDAQSKHVSWRLNKDGSTSQIIYGIYEPGADICHVPKNVTADWLEAARKFLQFALEDDRYYLKGSAREVLSKIRL